MTKIAGLISAAILLVACTGSPQVTRTQAVEAADAPYEKILVATLFKDFDYRRFLEEENLVILTSHDPQVAERYPDGI